MDHEKMIEKAVEMERDYFDDSQVYEMYDDFLDETNDMVRIGGLEYLPSYALKEVDPTAYRCGFNDWLDYSELDEVGDFYMSRSDIQDITIEIEAEEED